MKKSDLATLTFEARQLSQINDSSLDRLVEILESTFSAIATADPKMALSILEQLGEQKEAIRDAMTDREQQQKDFVKALSSRLPPMLEFEEEDEDDSGMN